MTESGWRNLSLVLGLVCALLLGVTAALLLSPPSGGGSPTAAPKSQPAAETTPTPPASKPASLPPATPSAVASPTKAPSPTPTPVPTPTPTPRPTQSAPTASVTFKSMQLDAEKDPNARARTFTFTSDGYGTVTAQVTATSPQGQTKLCASVDGSAPVCWTGAKPGMPLGYADTAHSVWTITLLGIDIFTPTVDVAFSWPTSHPSIRLTHGSFQGDPKPAELRGFTVRFKTRAAGNVGVQAAWPPLVADAKLTVNDVSAGTPILIDEKAYSGKGSVTPAYAQGIQANKTYEVKLADLSADSGHPDLTATITFP